MTPPEARRRLLVVDDDPNSLFIAQRHLLNAGYEVAAAGDFVPALEILEREGTRSFVAVVTDYCMPGGTGLDLLRRVRAMDATLSFVIATAVGEKQLVAESLREGASGFVDKPIQPELLRDSVAKAVQRTIEQRGVQQTVSAARAVGESQLALLGLHTAAVLDRIQIVYLPLSDASGDFVSSFRTAGDRVVILASDVSGHDLTAAYKSLYFHGLARGMIEQGAPIESVFRRFNDMLLRDWNHGGLVETSIAALGVEIEATSGRLAMLNCGFPHPVLSDAGGWAVAQDAVCGSPLGWFEDVPGAITASTAGGVLSFWSDGLEALADRLEVDPLAVAHRLLAPEADREALTCYAEDDIFAVRARLGHGIAPTGPAAVPLLRQVLSGDALARIDDLQAFWERCLRVALPDLDEERLFDVMLGLREAVINGLKHGCHASSERSVVILASWRAASRTLALRIKDDGAGHDFDLGAHEAAAATSLLAEHRGLVLMRNLAGRLDLAERGTQVTMEFSL
ncbi:MAG: response regulator [Opitutaceae bacterium]|nr:response regulator [Opitutaceae bacterium]